MKKFYILALIVTITSLLITESAVAQVAGDYRTNTNNVTWTTRTNWQRYNGSSWATPTVAQGYPGQNTGTGTVTILGSDAATITASIPNAIGALVIGDGTGTNESVIFSGTSAFTLTVTGSVTLNDGSLTVTNGNNAKVHTLSVGGDFTVGSTSIFTPLGGGAGDDELNITLNGTGTQTIGGTIASIGFQDLTINKASGGVTLSTDATIAAATANAAGALTLTSGIVTTTSTFLLTLNDGSTVSGASDASFVDGPLAKAGTANFSFPVGKTGVGYMQIDISSLTNAAAGTVFTAEYIRASAKATFGVTGLSGLGLQGVSNCEYWTIDRADAGDDATANITMYWNANSPCNSATYVANPPFGLRIVHYNTTTNQWDAHGGGSINGNSTAGDLTWSNVSNFSPFALGALNGSQSSLPVMYDNVKAYGKGTGVQIEWSNLTERELTKYEVERSLNGSNFTAISSHLPKSNRNDKVDYTDFDATPAQGTNYYRIKAYEIGGKLVYSKILRVEIGTSTQARFSVYPNPVTGNQVTVGLNNLKQGKYTVRIVNAAGQDVQKQTINVQSSSMTQTLQLSAAAKSGMYTMLISGDNFKESKVFIIK